MPNTYPKIATFVQEGKSDSACSIHPAMDPTKLCTLWCARPRTLVSRPSSVHKSFLMLFLVFPLVSFRAKHLWLSFMLGHTFFSGYRRESSLIFLAVR